MKLLELTNDSELCNFKFFFIQCVNRMVSVINTESDIEQVIISKNILNILTVWAATSS